MSEQSIAGFTVEWARKVLAFDADYWRDRLPQGVQLLRFYSGSRSAAASPTGLVPTLGLREASDLFRAVFPDSSRPAPPEPVVTRMAVEVHVGDRVHEVGVVLDDSLGGRQLVANMVRDWADDYEVDGDA